MRIVPVNTSAQIQFKGSLYVGTMSYDADKITKHDFDKKGNLRIHHTTNAGIKLIDIFEYRGTDADFVSTYNKACKTSVASVRLQDDDIKHIDRERVF